MTVAMKGRPYSKESYKFDGSKLTEFVNGAEPAFVESLNGRKLKYLRAARPFGRPHSSLTSTLTLPLVLTPVGLLEHPTCFSIFSSSCESKHKLKSDTVQEDYGQFGLPG